jgi:hypothetical protein
MAVVRPARPQYMAARDRLPASYTLRQYLEAGGLMCYGASFADVFR